MSQPAERRGRFCSVAAPASDGDGTAAFILLFCVYAPGLTSLTVPRCAVVWQVFHIFLATNLTLAKASLVTALCGAKRLHGPLDIHQTHAKHGPTHRRAARTFAHPDFPVGCSAVGRLFKGKLRAKKEKEND